MSAICYFGVATNYRLTCLKMDSNNTDNPLTLMPPEYCTSGHGSFNTSTMAQFIYGPYTRHDDRCMDFFGDPNVAVNRIGGSGGLDPLKTGNAAPGSHSSDRKTLLLSGLLIIYYHIMGYNYRLMTLVTFSVHMFVLFTFLEFNLI